MCDLAYVNLLREKVRQLKTAEKRVAAYGTTPHERFVPWTIPAPSQSHESGALLGARDDEASATRCV